jgi:alpha-L-fucosidase
MRRRLDARIKTGFAKRSGNSQGIVPPPVPHSDFRTPEYAKLPNISAKKWEATRGMSHSFGFNRNDTEADYAPFETLLGDFLDGVSKNGNLLLNVGPMADGTIPHEQMERLNKFGAWLRANGEAVYGTRPWANAEAITSDGTAVRFTTKGSKVYAILLGAPAGNEIRLRGVRLAGSARLLPDSSPVNLRSDGVDTVLGFSPRLNGAFAPVIAVES